jgi:hypothetical protein
VLGHGKFTSPGAGAAPIHVLHASTQGEHRSPAQNSGMGCLWCVQLWHLTCWKASSVEIVGKVSSRPGRAVCEIAYWVGLGFCSRATLERPNGKTL